MPYIKEYPYTIELHETKQAEVQNLTRAQTFNNASPGAGSPQTYKMSNSNSASSGQSYFEEQRSLLVQDVAAGLENVLQNLNKLNRSLEGVIAVGNEFSQVEGLWSQFENVMAKEPEKEEGKDSASEGEGAGEGS
ncbi:hypothetical protein AC578_4712 [Pseudocercospora eumusae]|uniref:DASH complex subunit DAD1 n=1 Tax=Pseudocercospora eumusae TaxID=321146 RepID=A0A139GZ62_9PEZI|nr:hypothetical protein AC578_4712 [Pseudocercospora eumusae]